LNGHAPFKGDEIFSPQPLNSHIDRIQRYKGDINAVVTLDL
jgi:hypothetical protein